MRIKKRSSQAGFSLIEALIAALVLGIGLLGIAGMTAAGLRSTDSANLRTQATILAEDILERMRANRAAAIAGDYDVADLDRVPECAEGSPLSACDLSSWMRSLERIFHGPDASSVDCTTAAPVCAVTISFDDSRGAVGLDPGGEPTVFVFRTRL